MNKNLRVQLHKALDWMIDNGNLPENNTYELVIQAYKAPYGQPEDHISKGCTAEVDVNGIQSSCEFEEDVTKLHRSDKEQQLIKGILDLVARMEADSKAAGGYPGDSSFSIGVTVKTQDELEETDFIAKFREYSTIIQHESEGWVLDEEPMVTDTEEDWNE